MTHTHSSQLISIACKHCGRVFSRVPYERIARHSVVECSACGRRFTIDSEELQEALRETLSRNETCNVDAQPPHEDASTAVGMEPADWQPSVGGDYCRDSQYDHEPFAAASQDLEDITASGVDAEQCSAAQRDSSGGQPEEFSADTGFDSESTMIIDPCGSDAIEEFIDFDSLDSPESCGYPAPVEETLCEAEATDDLEADAALEIDADGELEADAALEIDADGELEADAALEIDADGELEAGLPCAADEAVREDGQTLNGSTVEHVSSAQSMVSVPEGRTLEPEPHFSALPEDVPETPLPSLSVEGFEAEREDKFAFARRLSRLVPEGWVNMPYHPAEMPADGSTQDAVIAPDRSREEGRRQFLVCALGAAEFAVPIENTTEIANVPELTRMPNVADWLLGIANLRGDIISVVDLQHFLGMGFCAFDTHDRIVLLRSLQSDLLAAVIVNRVVGIHYIAEEDIVVSDGGLQSAGQYIGGAYEKDGRTIAVLDIEGVLLSDDMQQFRAL